MITHIFVGDAGYLAASDEYLTSSIIPVAAGGDPALLLTFLILLALEIWAVPRGGQKEGRCGRGQCACVPCWSSQPLPAFRAQVLSPPTPRPQPSP